MWLILLSGFALCGCRACVGCLPPYFFLIQVECWSYNHFSVCAVGYQLLATISLDIKWNLISVGKMLHFLASFVLLLLLHQFIVNVSIWLLYCHVMVFFFIATITIKTDVDSILSLSLVLLMPSYITIWVYLATAKCGRRRQSIAFSYVMKPWFWFQAKFRFSIFDFNIWSELMSFECIKWQCW